LLRFGDKNAEKPMILGSNGSIRAPRARIYWLDRSGIHPKENGVKCLARGGSGKNPPKYLELGDKID